MVPIDYFPTKADEKKARDTLRLLAKIFPVCGQKYRIWGSLLTAAIAGKVHRKLRDIDLLLNEEKAEDFFREIEKVGYRVQKKNYSLGNLKLLFFKAEKENCLDLNPFVGKFLVNGDFEIKLSPNSSVFAPAKAIIPTNYSLYGVNFLGVPATTNFVGAYISRANPKRKYDLEVMKNIKKDPEILKMDLIEIRYKSKKLSWLFKLLQFLENILGRIRIKLGLPFEIWE